MSGFAQQAASFLVKDVRLELRGRHSIGVVVPFAASQLIAFGLSLGPARPVLLEAAPGLLWLAVLFAAVLSFRGAYELEGEDGALESIVLAPIDRAAVFLGKAGAVALQLLVLEAIVVLLSEALFGIGPGGNIGVLFATMVLGTIGLSAIGSLFGVLTETARAREAVFPLLVLPLVVPVVVAAVKATAAADASNAAEAIPWLGTLAVFDLVFASAGAILFEHLIED